MTSMNTNRRRLAVALVFALVTCAFVAHFRAEGATSVRTLVDSNEEGVAGFLKAIGFSDSPLTALERRI